MLSKSMMDVRSQFDNLQFELTLVSTGLTDAGDRMSIVSWESWLYRNWSE
jgi:hypothetical protein